MVYLALTFGQQLTLVVLFVVLVNADYIIDDSNSTIQYTGYRLPPPADLDIDQLYQGTVKHLTCVTTDNCHVVIPFVGTGIDIYNVIRAQLNLSFTVDGGSSTPYTHEWNHSCFSLEIGVSSNANQGCHNTSVYNLQTLPYNNHTLDISMFTWTGSPAGLSNTSDFFFDYAVITSPISASTTSSSQHSHKPIAAAIGGALGGTTVIIALVLAVFYQKRKHRHKEPFHTAESSTPSMSIPVFAAASPGSPQTAPLQEPQNIVDARESVFNSVSGSQYNLTVYNIRSDPNIVERIVGEERVGSGQSDDVTLPTGCDGP